MASLQQSSQSFIKPYVIVEFPKDKPVSVEAIPRNWLITEKECYWPVNFKPTQLNKIISDPKSTPTKDWKKCVCRVLAEADDYKQAKLAAKVAEEQSDVESVLKPGKRLIRKPQKYSDSESDDCGDNDDLSTKELPCKSSTIPAPFSLCANSNLLNLQNSGRRLEFEQVQHLPLRNQDGAITIEIDGAFLNETVEALSQPTGEAHATVVPPPVHQGPSHSQPTTPRTSRVATPKQLVPEGSFEGLVLKYLAALNVSIADVLKRLENIECRLDKEQATGSGVVAQDDYSTLPLFPLENEQQLMNLENQLQIDQERNSLISYLSLIGGNGVNDTLKNIIKRVVHRDLALKITYTGKGNNKSAFNIYKGLEQCIIAAVRRNKKGNCLSATEDEIQNFLKDIFRYSRPRKPNNDED